MREEKNYARQELYKKFTEPTNLPCEVCGKPNSPRHYPMIENLDKKTSVSCILCWKCFHEVFAGET